MIKLSNEYWAYRIGQSLSSIGDKSGIVALSWWVLEVTGSAAQMTAVLAPSILLRIIAIPLSGPICDMFNRKILIAVSDLVRLIVYLLIAGMAFMNIYNMYALMVLLSISSIAVAVFSVSTSSIIPQIVPAESLSLAIRIDRGFKTSSNILGGVVAGVLISLIGVSNTLFFNSLTFIFGIIGVMILKISPVRTDKKKKNSISLWFTNLKQGFVFISKIRELILISLLFAIVTCVLSPMVVIIPYIIKELIKMPSWYFGLVESIFSIGLLLSLTSFGLLKKRFTDNVIVQIGILSVTLGLFSFSMYELHFIFTSIGPFLIGLGAAYVSTPLMTKVSLMIPNNYLGRVNSLISFISEGLGPLIISLVGVMIQLTSAKVLLMISAGFLFIIGNGLILFSGIKKVLKLSDTQIESFKKEIQSTIDQSLEK